MIKVNFVNNLKNTIDMLRDYNGKEITSREFENIKNDYFELHSDRVTSCFNTLKNAKVLVKTDREDDVVIKLDEPREIIRCYVNGAVVPNKRRFTYEDRRTLISLKIPFEERIEEVSEIQAKRYYYRVDTDSLEKLIETTIKSNKQQLKERLAEYEVKIKILKELLDDKEV